MNELAARRLELDETLVEKIREQCTLCGACVLKCDFLATYGHPGEIARDYDPETAGSMPFKCSLCGLCGAVCPESLDPAAMFLAMRRRAVERGEAPYRKQRRILNYERRGLSPAYTLEILPEGCDTVFFPGCALPGTRPRTTLALFELLRGAEPNLGVEMSCCAKPSHDLGMRDRFESAFRPLKERLLDSGVKTVLTACPSCYKVFSTYGGDLKVRTVYEVLAGSDGPGADGIKGEAVVHDSCAVRHEPQIHRAVRELSERSGLKLSEMRGKGEKTLCCGEGGNVAAVDRGLASIWTGKRAEQAKGKRLITYCAGCAGFLSPYADTVHLADLLADPERALSGRARVARPPFTYLNIRLLKRKFARLIG